MTDPRTWLAAILVFAALVLQVTLMSWLPLPGSAAPDLVLVVVAALAARTGPLRGCVTGFGAGLAADIVPPAFHTIGRYALIYCAVGYLVGLAKDEVKDSPLLAVLAVGAGALGGTVLYAGLGALFGDPRVTWTVMTRVIPIAVLYDVVLSPFALYVVARFTDRFDPERVGWRRLRGSRSSP